MSTADRRLNAVADSLSARERAIIAISCSNRDEQPDERLTKYMPPDQQQEFDRLVGAVERAIDEFYSNCILWCEWTHQTDLEMAWLECLAGMRDRESQLVAALKARGVVVRKAASASRQPKRETVVLTTLPLPGRGFRRDVPLLLGTLIHEEDAPPPDWASAVRSLATSVREAVEVRWQELAATETVLGEMAEAFGADCCHQRLRNALDAVRKKLMELYEAILPFAGRFRLPEPDARFLENFHDRVDWDAFESPELVEANVRAQDRLAWLSQDERAALEEIEARWKGEAQSLKATPARDISRDVPVLPAGRRRRKPTKAAGRT
jgi:hypothetical protein